MGRVEGAGPGCGDGRRHHAARAGVAGARRGGRPQPDPCDRRCPRGRGQSGDGRRGQGRGGGVRRHPEGAVRVAGKADQPRGARLAGRRSQLHDPSRNRGRGQGRQQPRSARSDDIGHGVRLPWRRRHGGCHPLLGGRADRVGRPRGARGPGAHGGRGAVHRAVAVAVSPLRRSRQPGGRGPVGQRERASTTPRGCSRSRSPRASRSTSWRS